MKESRKRLFHTGDRLVDLASYGLLALVAIGIAAFLIYSGRHPGMLSHNVIDCTNGYANARTAADTQIVDAQRPLHASRGQQSRLTCGTLRITGELGK